MPRRAERRPAGARIVRLARRERPPAGLEVFLLPLDDDTPLERLRALATPEDRARADRHRSPEDRRRLLCARAHLRRLAGARLDRPAEAVAFDYGPFGKPYVRDSTLGVGLARSGGLALIALGEGMQVGCDIEHVDPGFDWRAVQDAHVLAGSEARLLASKPPEEARALFFAMWALKEAALKCLGVGLSRPARSVVTCGARPCADGPEAALLALDPDFAAAVAWMSAS